jgi:hypothetical protein
VRQFASQKALLDYAEQTGLVYVWAYTQRERVLSPAFIEREHRLSPDQYEIVDVRTPRGVRRAMLFPKAILQDEFETTVEKITRVAGSTYFLHATGTNQLYALLLQR